MPDALLTRWLLPLALTLPLLGGCYDGLPDEAADPAALADPAPAPLAELLYAGEPDPLSSAQGDRVRAMIWLRRMDLVSSKLLALREASGRALASKSDLEMALYERAHAERARRAPLYQEMEEALARGEPTPEVLADWTERLADLQAPQAADGTEVSVASSAAASPAALKQRHLDAVLAEASTFLASLDGDERARAAEALFFLRRQVGPAITPEHWDALVGHPWPAGDFATLRRSISPEDPDPLDLRALWTLEAGEVDLLDGVGPDGLLMIMAFALLNPELIPACEALLGDDLPRKVDER